MLPDPIKTKYFECLSVVVNSTFLLASVYRPRAHKYRDAFLQEFDSYMSQLITEYSQVVVCGDKNLHFHLYREKHAFQFLDLASDFSLLDHVLGKPTHSKGGYLDVLLSKGLLCMLYCKSLTLSPMNKLPSGYSDQELAESLSGCFERKVEKILCLRCL